MAKSEIKKYYGSLDRGFGFEISQQLDPGGDVQRFEATAETVIYMRKVSRNKSVEISEPKASTPTIPESPYLGSF
jgi:hypothetical protein